MPWPLGCGRWCRPHRHFAKHERAVGRVVDEVRPRVVVPEPAGHAFDDQHRLGAFADGEEVLPAGSGAGNFRNVSQPMSRRTLPRMMIGLSAIAPAGRRSSCPNRSPVEGVAVVRLAVHLRAEVGDDGPVLRSSHGTSGVSFTGKPSEGGRAGGSLAGPLWHYRPRHLSVFCLSFV